MSADLPPLPATPLDAIEKTVTDSVIVEGRTFLIERAGASDRLLDHPYVQAVFAADEYRPYWTDLWPAARMLAKAVLREPWSGQPHALEIGCGRGAGC